MTTMTTFTSDKSLRNKQHVLTELHSFFINSRPPIGTILRPLITDDIDLIEKET